MTRLEKWKVVRPGCPFREKTECRYFCLVDLRHRDCSATSCPVTQWQKHPPAWADPNAPKDIPPPAEPAFEYAEFKDLRQ